MERRDRIRDEPIARVLDNLLEARGVVARTRSRDDRRVVTAAPTRQGRALVSRVPEVAQGLLLTGLEGLSARKPKAVAEGLDVTVGIPGARRLPPRLFFSRESNVPAAPASP